MISIVCVYNNDKILKNNLLKSLERQTSEYELILIDNTQNRYTSAAKALNCGGEKATGDYIMFVHQDVDFCKDTWLAEAEKILSSIPDLGIAGVAGMSDTGYTNKDRGRNIIKHGNPAMILSWGNAIQKPEIVQTLDECLIIIPKIVFSKLKFDESVCDGWHLYAVDYCLSCNRIGLKAYAIPMFIYHRSAGSSFSTQYYSTLKKVIKKHKKYYKKIYTTMGDWSTLCPLSVQMRKIKYLVKLRVSIAYGKVKEVIKH